MKTSVLFVITPVQLKLSWIHIQFRITREVQKLELLRN